MSDLVIESATKVYAGAKALNDVSLQLPDKVMTAVIGPSGSGKSSLLKLCNGLIRPDSGQVRVFGETLDYQNLPPIRRQLGYAVQGNLLFPHLTARENITLLATLEGWDPQRIQERLSELTRLCQIDEQHLDRYPHQLSGGQQQRVGLCRAMVLRPRVLLLDEPFGAIDPITREDIQQQILLLQAAEPRTCILVTHDMHEALLLASFIIVMNQGRVIHSGSKDELLGGRPTTDPRQLLRELLSSVDS